MTPVLDSPLGSEVVAIRGPEPDSWTANLEAGYFVGNVRNEWIGARRIRLLDDFAFVENLGDGKWHRWEALAGDVCDGSSIPWLLQRWAGSPFVGLHRFPSVPHDRACVERTMPSWRVHRMYLKGCLAAGQPYAKVYGRAVILSGPKFSGERER